MNKLVYSYAVLQYRHDVWVGEALNIGVLLSCEGKRFLKFKSRTGQGRIANAYPDLEFEALRDAVKALGRRFERLANKSGFLVPSGAAAEIGRKVLVQDDSSLSWGVSGTGLAEDPEVALEKVYARFVGRYDQVGGREARTDEMVFETLKKRLEITELYQRIRPHVVKSQFAEISFDHAIENGAWHVIQPLSFDSADEDRMLDKAAKWAGRLQSISGCEGKVRPYFVTGQPSESRLVPHYHKMVEFLKSSPMEPVVMDEAHSKELVAALAKNLH
jgi:Protein of unknown function (DUF3037)